jgi:hypothetical protein
MTIDQRLNVFCHTRYPPSRDIQFPSVLALSLLSHRHSYISRDPPPGQGISFVTVTRHLRMIRRHIEEIMDTSSRYQDPQQTWKDILKEQWELLWSGETDLRKYDTVLWTLIWTVGHKTVNLFPDETSTSVPDHRTILEINRLDEPISQLGTTRERPIMGLLHRNRDMISSPPKILSWKN